MDSPDAYEGSSTPRRSKQEGELEVTGISRSGRVRKKSSKLTDFESPDEIERFGRKRGVEFNQGPFSRTVSVPKKLPLPKQPEPNFPTDEDEPVGGVSFEMKEEILSESDNEMGLFQHDDGEDSMDSMGTPVDDEDLDDQIGVDHESSEGFQRLGAVNTADSGSPAHSSAQSLYMMEKSTKKKLIIRDGKIVGRMKAQRKDKGKTRFTAYMLWAKEIRQELMKSNPELDFSQTSKRLGELWATVPFNEKYIWKRRAKRLAAKGVKAEKHQLPPALNTQSSATVSTTAATPTTPAKKSKASSRKFINKQQSSAANAVSPQAQTQIIQVSNFALSPPEHTNSRSSKSSAGLVSEPVVGPGLYKVVGTAPIDIAAHLRLLGESLSIIGERLKEHDGQIAVSGSLSVLLDSLLCVLGPLLCLTQQVPEMNVCSQQQLNKILDNIAYIMPGL